VGKRETKEGRERERDGGREGGWGWENALTVVREGYEGERERGRERGMRERGREGARETQRNLT